MRIGCKWLKSGPYSYRDLFSELAAWDVKSALKFFTEMVSFGSSEKIKTCLFQEEHGPSTVFVDKNMLGLSFFSWDGELPVAIGFCKDCLLRNDFYGKRARRALRLFYKNMHGLLVEVEKTMEMLDKES